MYNEKAMFKKILSIVTLLLVGVVVYGARNEIVSAFQCIFGGQCMDGSHFSINFWIVLLLIPEQLFMYYSAGKIFFSYMAGLNLRKISPEFPLVNLPNLRKLNLERPMLILMLT